MKWGTLINAALDCGLDAEDALWAVLCTAARIEREGLDGPLRLTAGEVRALKALDEHGSYHAAAEALSVAQSTVHRQTKIAARKLGVPARYAIAEAERVGLLERRAA